MNQTKADFNGMINFLKAKIQIVYPLLESDATYSMFQLRENNGIRFIGCLDFFRQHNKHAGAAKTLLEEAFTDGNFSGLDLVGSVKVALESVSTDVKAKRYASSPSSPTLAQRKLY